MKAGGASMRTCRWAAVVTACAAMAGTGCGSSGGTTTGFASEQETQSRRARGASSSRGVSSIRGSRRSSRHPARRAC